jgi:hypothetical protein
MRSIRFLYGLDINSIYGLKIDVISNELSCYMEC